MSLPTAPLRITTGLNYARPASEQPPRRGPRDGRRQPRPRAPLLSVMVGIVDIGSSRLVAASTAYPSSTLGRLAVGRVSCRPGPPGPELQWGPREPGLGPPRRSGWRWNRHSRHYGRPRWIRKPRHLRRRSPASPAPPGRLRPVRQKPLLIGGQRSPQLHFPQHRCIDTRSRSRPPKCGSGRYRRPRAQHRLGPMSDTSLRPPPPPPRLSQSSPVRRWSQTKPWSRTKPWPPPMSSWRPYCRFWTRSSSEPIRLSRHQPRRGLSWSLPRA
jgi:hypothetical protein